MEPGHGDLEYFTCFAPWNAAPSYLEPSYLECRLHVRVTVLQLISRHVHAACPSSCLDIGMLIVDATRRGSHDNAHGEAVMMHEATL